jgi:serine/threonine protein phosphatase 1
MKKYFVFSDVHGDFLALKMNLIKMGFDENNDDHILFSLGDLFDRGPASDKVLEYMLKFWEVGRFIGVRGNHDEMLLGYMNQHHALGFNLIYNGLDATINQLSGGHRVSAQVLRFQSVDYAEKIKVNYPKLMDFLQDLKLSYEFGKYVFIHAGFSTDRGSDWYVDNWADTPTFIISFDPGDKTYVFGHWHTHKLNGLFGIGEIEDAYIFQKGNFIGIDMTTNRSHEVAVCVLSSDNGIDYDLAFDPDKVLA